MKRIIILTLLLSMALAQAVAQKDMAVTPVFAGKIVPKKRMEETLVKGESIHKFKLSLFRSLKMEVSTAERDSIESLVLHDVEGLEDSPEAEYEMKDGHLSYCISSLPAQQKCYLCYQCYESRPGNYQLTLVYIEGWATLKDLHHTFKRK
ncbi:MAG: DUF6108 family protein [Bacteroidaceae bacterium]|nr:DUF6108 family protein [Bacteroidaceae bacterium]